MATRHTFLVELSYLGRYFYGVQPQPGLRTVGSELRERLTKAFGQRPRGLTFAARTDSGVSAVSNFATCWVRLSEHEVQRALHQLAQPEVSALTLRSVRLTPRSMNARMCATSKHYRYAVNYGPAPLAEAWNVETPLDVGHMRRAAHFLVGTHDFSSFRSKNCAANSPVKHIHHIGIQARGQRVWIDIEGSSFLRKMVRILCGTLVEVGAGQRDANDVPGIVAARHRSAAGRTAPAHGLCLMRVDLKWPDMRHPGAPLMLLGAR